MNPLRVPLAVTAAPEVLVRPAVFRRALFRGACFVGLAVLFGVPLVVAPLGRAAETLVPAQFNQRQDLQGFSWQLTPQGGLGSDNRGCLNNGFAPLVGGQQARFPQTQMTADGGTYVFSGWQYQRVEISRRVRFDVKQSTAQFIDSFKNIGSTTTSLVFVQHTRLANQAQGLLSDQAQPFTGAWGPKDSGFLAVAQPGVPSPVFFLGTPRSKVRPSVSIQSNYQFTFSYALTIPAGKTVSVVSGMGQTNLVAPPDAAGMKAVFKPFNETAWLRTIPADVRGTIVNAAAGGFNFGEEWESADALAELGERGPHDLLLVGDATRLRGTLAGGALSIEAGRGPRILPLERIAAVYGGNSRGRVPKIVLRDGQVLVGPLRIPDLKFTLNSGLDVTCSLTDVDRLVLHEGPDDGKPVSEVFAYVDLLEGDRLAVKQGERQTITALTAWGVAEIGLEEIDLWSSGNPSEGTVTHRLVLRDGSSFSSMIGDGRLQLMSAEYGPQSWSVFDVRRLRAAHRKASSTEPADPTAPYAVLAGENRFVAQVDLPLVHLVVQGQTIPAAPAQLKSLRREETSAPLSPGSRSGMFIAEFWDGDVAVGTLEETTLPLRTVGGVLQVPVSDLVELRTPTPTVPDSLRGRITELLADLGHVEWARREAAGKELRSLGAVVREQGEDVLKTTTDPEVRKRLQALIDAVKE